MANRHSNLDSNPYAPSQDFDGGTNDRGSVAWMLFSFEGRLSRSQYWLCWLGAMGVLLPSYLAAALISEDLFMMIVLLSLIPAAWIGIAIEVKRWHDLGMSGLWFFLGFVPYIGGLIKLVMLGFLPSDGPNQYDRAYL